MSMHPEPKATYQRPQLESEQTFQLLIGASLPIKTDALENPLGDFLESGDSQ